MFNVMKKLLFLSLFMLNFSLLLVAQEREIKGNVTDAGDGSPLIGVAVQAIGENSIYAVTDDYGNYKLTITGKTSKLKFTYLGYLPTEINVTSNVIYNVALRQDVQTLPETVVTALGISREKKTLGYSVQEVKSEQLNLNKSTNIVNSLQGKVAGVQISQGGSAMGASSRIVIRGNGGFADNSPLWVIDGVPINSGSTSVSGAGGIDYGSAISDLDANNIESMTILKGASASALYGSRAINGVVVVKTKSGKDNSNKIGIEINSSFISQVPSYFPKLQKEYGMGDWGDEYSYNNRVDENGVAVKNKYSSYNDYLNNESYRYVDGINGVNESAISWGGRLNAGLTLDQWSTGKNSPWVSRPGNIKYWFDNGYDLENNISITSNGEKASGRISYTNLTSKGIVPYTDQSQNSINLSTTLSPVKGLVVKTDITYLRKNSDNLQQFGYNYADIYAWRGVNYDVKYLRDMYEKDGINACEYPQSNNYFWALDNIRNSFSRERLYGNISASLNITKWMNITARYGTDTFLERKKSVTPSTSWDMINGKKNGSFSRSNYSFREDNADLLLNFDKTFGKFRVDGFLGGNYRYLKTDSEWMSAPDLTVPDLYVMSNVKGTAQVGNSLTKLKSYSVFFAVNASYNNWAFIGITGRNDWNSTLPVDNQSYFYPALNLGISITDAFGIKSDILNYAKPRFNIAQVGGATSPYRLQEVYGIGKYNNVSIMYPANQYPPKNLKPQKATSWEVGVDARLFKSKLTVDLTYYERTTKNMIMDVPISQTSGYSSMLINAGEIFNKGFEVILGGKIVENHKGFNMDLNVNWATNKNKIVKLYQGITQYEIAGGYGSCSVVATEGEDWGLLYGKAYERNANGEIVNNSNGLPKTGPSEYLGKVTPDWTGGIIANFGYKGITLNAVIDMSVGNKFFSVSKWHSYPTGAYNNTVKDGVRENGIIGPGVIEVFDAKGEVSGYTPNNVRMSAENYFNAGWVWNNHEYSVLSGSYVKLRELSLSYQHNFKENSVLKGFTVALTCRNVAILYRSKECRELGIDPETQFGGTESGVGVENFNLPGTRSYGVKLNLKF